MSSKDAFRSTRQSGNSLDILARVNEYFYATHGVGVFRYEFVSSPSRAVDVEFLSSKDLRKCCICGTKLYTDDSDYDRGVLSTRFRSKKYMRFLSNRNEWHYTCHGISRCLKKAGWDMEKEPTLELPMPEYEEFISYEGDMDEPSYVASNADFDLRVKPFLARWASSNINKGNVVEFIDDLEACLVHLERYDERDRQKIREKILRLAGVTE